ncbi:MAG: hypothetical protein KatS3mg108_2214 [Isosphaeraceae bacterium]|jgi:chromosome segregation ATPase|nr:MAG: hypothetical protein KatS3mg108_2214 [Isosphaeraceae bacterium]
MKCGIVKGSLLGLALGSAALFWVFGGRAFDLISWKANKAREMVKKSITSFDDEINMARAQVKKLDPAIAEGAEALARLEDSVKQVSGEVERLRMALAEKGRRIETLRASLDKPVVQRVGSSGGELKAKIEAALARSIDEYRQVERTLGYAQDTLKYRQALVQTAHDQLLEMQAKKKTLQSKIDEIEARHKARLASQQFSEFRVDTSPLAEAERAVAELDSQESVSARADELKSELADLPAFDTLPADRDVRQEADAILQGATAAVGDPSA